MSIIIRIITTEGYCEDGYTFVEIFNDILNCASTPELICCCDYWKMPNHKEVSIEIKHPTISFKDVVSKCGSNPALLTEDEVIFDNLQGSTISIKHIFWLHIEMRY